MEAVFSFILLFITGVSVLEAYTHFSYIGFFSLHSKSLSLSLSLSVWGRLSLIFFTPQAFFFTTQMFTLWILELEKDTYIHIPAFLFLFIPLLSTFRLSTTTSLFPLRSGINDHISSFFLSLSRYIHSHQVDLVFSCYF